MKIKKIEPAGTEPVYNMTVDIHHNYMISGGLILKNCDALRYFAQLRTLPAEKQAEAEDEEWSGDTSYEDYMCGGEAGYGYLAG